MAGTAVWVDVLPSLKGFGSKLTTGVIQEATIAGTKAGQAFSSSMDAAASSKPLSKQIQQLKAAEAEAQDSVKTLTDQTDRLKDAQKHCATEVKTATSAIKKARDEQKTAALNTEAAEKRLQEVIAKHGEGSSQAVSAAARLNDARSKQAQKAEAVERAEERLTAAHRANKETSEQVKTAEDKLSKASNQLKDIQGKLATETEKSDKKANSLRGRLQQWASSANAAKNESDKLANSTVTLGDVSNKAAGKIGALAGIAQSAFSKVTSVISSSIGAAVERTDLMNNFPKVMSNLGFSAEDAAKSVQKISGALDGLPTASSAMTGMVQQLAPLTSSLDEATNISLAFNNAMLAGGASTTEQENALTQYQQMLAAGKVDMAAWRSIQAAMPGQLNQLAEAMLGAGKNANDLYEEMKNGTVGFEEFNKTIVKLNTEGTGQYASFAQQAKTATQGIGTAMENAKNRVAKQIQKVIEAFGVDRISNAINQFTSSFAVVGDAAANMVRNTLGWFENLYDKLEQTGAIDTLKNAWKNLTDTFTSIQWDQLLPSSVIEGFSWTIAQAFTLVTDSISWVTDTIGKAIDKVGEFFEGFASTGVFDAWIDVAGTLIEIFADVRDTIWGVIQNVLGLNDESGQMQSFGETVGNVFKTLAEIIKPVIDKLGELADWASQQGANAFKTMTEFIQPAIDKLGELSDWASQHADYIEGALIGIGSAVAAWNISSMVSAAVDWFGKLPSIITTVQGAMSGLNAVMHANAFGIIVTAISAVVGALTWFFTQTETGQKMWQAITDWFTTTWNTISGWFGEVMDGIGNAWQSVCDAFAAAWNWVDQNVIQPFKTGIDAIGSALQWFNDNVVQPVWNAIKTAFQIAFLVISTAVITPFKLAIDAIGAVFRWLYDNVIKPVWDSIVDAFTTAWEWIDSNIIQPFKLAWDLLAIAFDAVGQSLQAAWQAVYDAFKTVWDWIDQNIVQRFRDAWDELKLAYDLVCDGLKTAWQWVQDKFKTVWDWINSNIVQRFKDAWDAAKQKFTSITNGIKNAWEGVKNAFKTVWEWIDKHIISPFKDGIKKLGDSFDNMKKAAETAFNNLKEACSKPVRWIVETVYTNGIQKVWNGIAGAVGLDNLKLPDAPKFATGGVTAAPANSPNGFQHFATGGTINPGYSPRHDSIISVTSPGEAIMVPEFTRAVGAENIHAWNKAARMRGPAAFRQEMGLYATGGVVETLPHFADGGVFGRIGQKASDAWEWTKKTASDFADAASAFLKDPGAWITSKIVEPVKALIANVSNGNWGQMVAQLPLKVAQGLVQKAKDAISGWFGGGSVSSAVNTAAYKGSFGSGVEQWRSLVIECLKEVGQPVSLADTVLRRMNQESGGNPNAINNWDINAKNGVPSQGLMQCIPPTFAAYAGPYANRSITDPKANIYASMKYALARYGSLSAAYNRAGGYSFGGVVDEPRATLYDRGGVLNPGHTLVENRTKQPELVVTREQVKRLFHLEERDGGTMNLTVNVPERSDPWSEAAIWVNTARSMIGGR